MKENRLIQWLITRGITPSVIELFSISVVEHKLMGEAIRIPVDGTPYAKYRRDPIQDIKPKYIADYGLKATLFGATKIHDVDMVLITEGELDALVSWSNNIPAVSSTAGSKTFLKEWVDILKDKQVVVCFDNDQAGAEGVVKILSLIPHAKVILIPVRPNIKDITDYVQAGGDLRELLKTAKHFTSIESVKEDRAAKISVFESVLFHEAYLEAFTPKQIPNSRPYTAKDDSNVEKAKTYPIDKLIKFTNKKACCIWHNEKTPSLTYYPKTNSVYCFGCGKYGDAIDVYREIHGCDFKTALNEMV